MLRPSALHPVFRYVNILLCSLAAAATVWVSWKINPHALPWHLALYATVVVWLAGWRERTRSPLMRAHLLYLFLLGYYVFIVWYLHVCPPGKGDRPDVPYFSVLYPLIALGSIFVAISLLRFVLILCECRWRPLFWIETFGWIISAFFGVLCLTGKWIESFHWGGQTWVPNLDGWYPEFFILTTFYVWFALGLACVQFFRIRDRQRRLRIFYWLVGALPAWLSCWAHFLISMGIEIYPAGGILFLAHALIMAYAVQRRVYDFTFAVRRGLAYALFSLLIGLLYAGTLSLAHAWTGREHASTASAVAFVGLIALLHAPLLSLLRAALDRAFFRDESDRQRNLERFTREAASTIDLETLARGLCGLLADTLKPRRVSLYLEDANGDLILFGVHADRFERRPWPKGEPLPKLLHGALAAPRRFPMQRSAPEGHGLQFTEGDEALAVPILHRDRALGLLHLEPKRADEPYSDEDLRVAETIAAQSSLALQNARAFAEMERMQDFTRQTMESLATGVLVVSASGRILSANSAAKAICRFDDARFPAELTALTVVHPALGEEIRRSVQAGAARENQSVTLAGERPVHLLLSTRELGAQDGEALNLVILHDISEYKAMESVAQRKESLARVGEAISSINHEIKNILQPVRSQVERLSLVETEDRVIKRAMDVIPDRLDALDKLLANLRDLARPIELRPRAVDLANLVESVLRDAGELPQADGVTLRSEIAPDAPTCWADGHWLRQVLFNLVRNGMEATAGRAERCVMVSATQDGNESVIAVRDTGAGINAEGQKRIFEPFYSTKGESGTGLGLSISRKIIELHGGRITFESEGVGTVFRVHLPVGVK